MLRQLPDLVTIRLFASSSLPPEVAFLRRDVDDLLGDYRSAGQGKVRVVVMDPTRDTAAARQAEALPNPAGAVQRGGARVSPNERGIPRPGGPIRERHPPDPPLSGSRTTSNTGSRRSFGSSRRRPSPFWFGFAPGMTAGHPGRRRAMLRSVASTGGAGTQLRRSGPSPSRPTAAFPTRPKCWCSPGVSIDSLVPGQLGPLQRIPLPRSGNILLMAGGMARAPQGQMAMARPVGWECP